MGRSKRVTVATGVYRDATGYTVVARLGSGASERSSDPLRFPLEPADSTPAERDAYVNTLIARQLREKAALVETRTIAAPGTMAGDVEEYFKTATLTARRVAERRQQLTWWAARVGTRRRATLTAPELRRILNTLAKSASTRNKYRTALSNMYTVLDGKSAVNPFRDCERDAEPDAARRDQPTIIVDAILAEMRIRGRKKHTLSRTRARFYVLAYAPVTNAQLCRMTESDIDLERGIMYAGGRQKGKKSQATGPKAKALEPDAITAFQMFAAAGCWTAQAIAPPSRHSMHRTFTAARDRAIAKLEKSHPELVADLARARTMRPYDLRHSYAAAVVTAAGLDTARVLLDHADLRTTLKYAQGAVAAHLVTARDAIAAQRARDRQVTP